MLPGSYGIPLICKVASIVVVQAAVQIARMVEPAYQVTARSMITY